MIESERDETENGPPDAHHLRGEITALQSKVATHTDEPVAADTTEENLVPFGSARFFTVNNYQVVWVCIVLDKKSTLRIPL